MAKIEFGTGYFILIVIYRIKCQNETIDNAASDDNSNSRRIFGVDVSGVDGDMDDNVSTIPIRQTKNITFYGTNLNNSRVAFVPKEDDSDSATCDKVVNELVIQTEIVENWKAVINFGDIIFEETYDKLYPCLRSDSGIWEYQGSSEFQTLRVTGVNINLWISIILYLALLFTSGLISGVGLGLLTLDKNELKVLSERGSKSQKRNAKAIVPVRKHSNFLLCSLLLANTVVNATMPVLLTFVSGYVALSISTITIVLFGEIIPQAICSRHGLIIGAKTIYITYFFMVITSPVSWPVSLLLDRLLGEETGIGLDRDALMEYINLTREQNKLDDEEVNIIFGALELNKRLVKDAMTALDYIYMIPATAVLDTELVQEIIKHGYSRVPIYKRDRSNVIAILYVKDLLLYYPVKNSPMPVEMIARMPKRSLLFLEEDEQLIVGLRRFKEAKCHLAFVKPTGRKDKGIVGLITLEDVLEEILKAEILDETDTFKDSRKQEVRKEAQIRSDLVAVLKKAEGHPASHFLSPQMILAIQLFLATGVTIFGAKYISKPILEKLTEQRLYHRVMISKEPDDQQIKPVTLYHKGKPADYFIMVVEGSVKITFANQELTFEGKAFTHFGIKALHISDENLARLGASEQSLTSTNNSKLFQQFNPDYTVQILDYCLYMKIDQSVYLTACKASIREKLLDIKSNRSLGLTTPQVTTPKESRSKSLPKPIKSVKNAKRVNSSRKSSRKSNKSVKRPK